MEPHNEHPHHSHHSITKEEDIKPENEPSSVKKPSIFKGAYLLPGSILLASLIIAGSISYSTKILLTKSDGLAGIVQKNNQVAQAPAAPAQAAAAQPDAGPAQVSADNDPVLGDKNAPLTIIEFSDYECPFCKRSFTDVLPNLKKDYIDTGKVKLVYRDFPLSFHQNAQKEAEAAECARTQGGDGVYYKFHDQIFTKTTSNGTGLALDQLPVIAKNLGLNVSQFQQCLDSGKYKDEVAKDMADGSAAGVSGTPTWFIGKSNSNGNITGTRVVGAQPYAAFKTIIDQQLTK